MPTHYDVLGVSPGASPEEIRRAYHRQARAWHPDRYASRPADEAERAERAMRHVNEAFRVLGDRGRRSEYDRSLDGRSNSAGPTDGSGAEPRIDPRLLDPEYLVQRRNQREAAVASSHSRIINMVPWIGLLGALALIFIFTAYAARSDGDGGLDSPGPDIGVAPNSCVRVIEGGALITVPCDGIIDGVVIGARFPDGNCPAGTRREVAVAEDRIVCLG